MPNYLNSQFHTTNFQSVVGQGVYQENSLNKETQLSDLAKQLDLLWFNCFVCTFINHNCSKTLEQLQKDNKEMREHSFEIKKSQKAVGERLQQLDESRIHVEKTMGDLEKNIATLEQQLTEKVEIQTQKEIGPVDHHVEKVEFNPKNEVEDKQLTEEVEAVIPQEVLKKSIEPFPQTKNSDEKILEQSLKPEIKEIIHQAPSPVIPKVQESSSNLKNSVKFIESQPQSESQISYPSGPRQIDEKNLFMQEKKQNSCEKICQVIKNLFFNLFFYWPLQLVSYTWKKIHVSRRSAHENLSIQSSKQSTLHSARIL